MWAGWVLVGSCGLVAFGGAAIDAVRRGLAWRRRPHPLWRDPSEGLR